MNIPPLPGNPQLLVAGDKTRYILIRKLKPTAEPKPIFHYQVRTKPGESMRDAALRIIDESPLPPEVKKSYLELIDEIFREN